MSTQSTAGLLERLILAMVPADRAQAIVGDLQEEMPLGATRFEMCCCNLRAVIAAKIAEMANTIAMFDAGKHDEALEVVRSNKGKGLMETYFLYHAR